MSGIGKFTSCRVQQPAIVFRGDISDQLMSVLVDGAKKRCKRFLHFLSWSLLFKGIATTIDYEQIMTWSFGLSKLLWRILRILMGCGKLYYFTVEKS